MPNIKSAEKRVITSEKNRMRNKSVLSAMKTSVKKALAAGDEAGLSKAVSAIDKAASKGVIHKNTANRKKARLAKKITQAAK